jgi:hypothetical protein
MLLLAALLCNYGRGKCLIDIGTEGCQSQIVNISIHEEGCTLASAMSLADGPRAVVSAHISDPKLWSPNAPHLYSLRIELHGTEGLLDTADSYFGIRSIGTESRLRSTSCGRFADRWCTSGHFRFVTGITKTSLQFGAIAVRW